MAQDQLQKSKRNMLIHGDTKPNPVKAFFTKLLAILAVAFFLLFGLVSYLFDFSNAFGIQYNTRGIIGFFGAQHAYELILAALIVAWIYEPWKVNHKQPEGEDGGNSIMNHWITKLLFKFVGFLLLTLASLHMIYLPLFGINYLTAKPTKQCTVQAELKETYRPKTYHIYLHIAPDDIYDYHASHAFFKECEQDGTRIFKVQWKKGALGYDFIDDVIPANDNRLNND